MGGEALGDRGGEARLVDDREVAGLVNFSFVDLLNLSLLCVYLLHLLEVLHLVNFCNILYFFLLYTCFTCFTSQKFYIWLLWSNNIFSILVTLVEGEGRQSCPGSTWLRSHAPIGEK